MTFILLKKQLLEVNRFLFQKRKTGDLRKKSGVIGMFALFALVLVFLMVMFFVVALSMAITLLGNGNDWLYFALQGMMAILFGTFGSVFNTYSQLYKSNDNELLISMPIPPRCILLSRMIVVVLMSFLYSGLIWIPATVAYFVIGQPTLLAVVFSILNIFVISIFVSALTCGMGFLVALCSKKMANKSIAVTVISVLFFVVYYYVCFNLNNLLEELVANSEKIGRGIAIYIWPLYQLGLASLGGVIPMIINTLICVGVFVICYFILTKTFLSINMSPDVIKKVEYKSKAIKSKTVSEALIGREAKRFVNSTTYMLNGGLGLGFLPVVAILSYYKRTAVIEYYEVIATEAPILLNLVPVVILGFLMLLVSLNVISAASVSMEGKNVWIVQSMPVEAKDVLRAKEQFHVRVNLVPAVFASLLMGVAFNVSIITIVISCAVMYMFITLCADTGLMLNLKLPNLNWTNESAPVKNGMPVVIVLFSGMILAVLSCGLYIPLSFWMPVNGYMCILFVVFLLLVIIEKKWIYNTGAEIFKNL